MRNKSWNHFVENELEFKDQSEIDKVNLFLDEVYQNSKCWEEISGMFRIFKKLIHKINLHSLWFESDLIQNIREDKINNLIKSESYRLIRMEEKIKYNPDILSSSGYSGSSSEMIYFECVDLVIQSILKNDNLDQNFFITTQSIKVENNTFIFSFYQKI